MFRLVQLHAQVSGVVQAERRNLLGRKGSHGGRELLEPSSRVSSPNIGVFGAGPLESPEELTRSLAHTSFSSSDLVNESKTHMMLLPQGNLAVVRTSCNFNPIRPEIP